MIPFEFIGILPGAGGSPAHQAEECLRLLETRLRSSGRNGRQVLSLTFFVDAPDAAAYRRRRKSLLQIVRNSSGTPSPPAGVVAQLPERACRVALEAVVLAPSSKKFRVERKAVRGAAYTVVSGAGMRQIHAAGIADDEGRGGLELRAKEAFAKMEAVLRRERMDFGLVVRQWNYIEGLLGLRSSAGKKRQNYQAFNDIRTLAYEGSIFPTGYPAATGIGQSSGGVILEFIALEGPPDLRVVPVSNPRQTDPHRYSDVVLVGTPLPTVSRKTSPKFERAKLVARGPAETVFVSGTAAVLGEGSVGRGDVAAQTRTTIDNIAALTGGRNLAYLRGYVKRAKDIPKVREICERAYGPIPALFVQADICRPELLVELEGFSTGGV